jgi:hypothetical protein
MLPTATFDAPEGASNAWPALDLAVVQERQQSRRASETGPGDAVRPGVLKRRTARSAGRTATALIA